MSDSRRRPTLILPVAGTRLRPWQLSDASTLTACANDEGVAQNLRDTFPYPYLLEDARWYLEAVATANSPDIHLAIEVEGAAGGGISIIFQHDVDRRSAEIGYWLGRSYWGRGIMTAAVRVLTEYTFASFDVCRLYAGVFAHNAASARVLEKGGYELEGRLRKSITKNGHTIDSLLYAVVNEQ
ncbi:GNAT family protein [Hymenobacter sp. GOD-10R]|uniref:GNAT family N-acetyltransferase n=1 Tax=Hymenobacter sp. GOD-10R TaxID=3093922 RepID=UPI002D78B639|nr:GNAT family protein [Hymenobacter sp. GOD-10R]WRQ28475.1 GNAT family protein [Hymenobacter sp. GOD-10R]